MSDKECNCKQYEVSRYKNKISGPLLDRFDMFVEVNQVSFEDLKSCKQSESSIDIKKRVENAREIQYKRFKNDTIKTNNEIKSSKIDKYCEMDNDAIEVIKLIFNRYKLSNRSYTKLLKMARTIADLDESLIINSSHINEAFSYRRAYYTYFG